MMLRKLLSFINKDNRGFTLIEMMVVLALTGVIGNALVITINTTTDTVGKSRNQVDSTCQVRTAELWIQKDGKMAHTINLGSPSATGLPVTLVWHDWDGNKYQATYAIEDNVLVRNYEVLSPDNTVIESLTQIIAEDIVAGSPQTTCRVIETGDKAGEIIFTMTVQQGDDKQKGLAIRTFEVRPRPA